MKAEEKSESVNHEKSSKQIGKSEFSDIGKDSRGNFEREQFGNDVAQRKAVTKKGDSHQDHVT